MCRVTSHPLALTLGFALGAPVFRRMALGFRPGARVFSPVACGPGWDFAGWLGINGAIAGPTSGLPWHSGRLLPFVLCPTGRPQAVHFRQTRGSRRTGGRGSRRDSTCGATLEARPVSSSCCPLATERTLGARVEVVGRALLAAHLTTVRVDCLAPASRQPVTSPARLAHG